MKPWLLALFALGVSLFGEADPNAVRENQRVTVEMFPELGVKDSPLNKRFVERVQKYRTDKSKLFDSDKWPYRIAEECVAELRLEQNIAASYERAYRRFPELKIEGSPLQKRFVERSNEYLDLHISRSVSEDWPYRTAEQCVEELRTENARTASNSITVNASTDGNGASRTSPSLHSQTSVSPPPASAKAGTKSGGAIAVVVVVVMVGLVVLARSPANFFRILVDLLGLNSVREFGRKLSGSTSSPARSEQKPQGGMRTYSVVMRVPDPRGGKRTLRTTVTARSVFEARDLVEAQYSGVENITVTEMRR